MSKKPAQTDFTRELDNSISKLKEEKEERSMYLTYTSRMMECRQDGYQEGISIGLERGRLEGLEHGAYQNKLETARSLMQDGFSAEMVSKYTSLPLETVERLEKEE